MIEACSGCGNRPHTQDELHGKGNRVFNEVPLKTGGHELRCTVCGSKKLRGAADKKAKADKA